MGLLKFDIKEVEKLIRHSLAAPKHAQIWFEREEGLDPYPALWFVKDDGIYLMSNGDPKLDADDGDGHYVVYAKGFDPRKDEDVWDAARDAVGGDDFGESLAIDKAWIEDIETHSYKWFCIFVTPTTFTVSFQ